MPEPCAFVLSLLAPLLLAPSAMAAPSLFDAIEADREAGLLEDHDALMQTFYGVFRPDLLAPGFAAFDRTDTPRCATTLVMDLKAHWDDLDGTERHVVDLATNPIYRGWVDQGGETWEQIDVAALWAEERATCMSPGTAFPNGGPYGGQHDTEHFSLRYNLGGDVSEGRIEALGGWFEESLEIEHEQMGFFLPSNMVSYQLLVMVETLPPATGGFTSVAQCGLGGYMAYIVINTQWFEDVERLQSAAAHEFFHGIQMEYAANELFFTQEPSPNRWWVEGSAVFMETEVYPNLFNSQFSQAARWFFEPYRSLATHDTTGFQYGTYLFAASVRQSFDEADWFHESWDQILGRTGYDLVEEFDVLFQTRDSSFREQYGLFLQRMATGDLDFNPYMQLDDGYIEVELTDEHDEDDYPLDESVNSSSGLDRPEYLGANYIRLDGRGIDDDKALWVTFDGSGRKGGTEIDWEVHLVAVEDDEPKAAYAMPIEAIYNTDGELDAWFGEALVNDFGEDFDAVYLIASPVVDFGDGGATWSYTAEVTDTWGDGGIEPVPEELKNPSDDDEEPGAGCGQASIPGAASGLSAAWLALLLLIGVRRRP